MSDHEEYDVLTALHDIMETNQEFYRTIRFLGADTRNMIVAAHERNTSLALTIVRSYLASSATMTFNIPIQIPATNEAMTSFMEPVPVVPTPEQVLAAVEQHVNVPDAVCSICQESVACATRIRACGHCFHSQCIGQWFSMNTHCPMCRHDIRTV